MALSRRTDCEGFYRRDFLKIGAAGVFGLNLPELLRWEAQAKAETPAAANQSAPNFAMLTSWHNMVLLTTAAEDSLESALVPGSWREYRAQVIDLEGLPGPVAKAIAETVLNVRDITEGRDKIRRSRSTIFHHVLER